MNNHLTLPSPLLPSQKTAVLRALCNTINYWSDAEDSCPAHLERDGLLCKYWSGLPDWVDSVHVRCIDKGIEVHATEKRDVSENEEAQFNELTREYLTRHFLYPVQRYPKRVFCVGWAKTGTTSLAQALRQLGFLSLHFAPWCIGLPHRLTNTLPGSFDPKGFQEFNAVADWPFSVLYKQLDNLFQNSLFILTIRELSAWTVSAEAHWSAHIQECGTMYSLDRWAHDYLPYSREVIQERYLLHNMEVQEYFKGRSDFLVLDVSAPNPWKELCSFLKLPVPDSPFPHLNKRMEI